MNAGQTDPSDAAIGFFCVLYTGSNKPFWEDRVDKLVNSMSDDMLFVITCTRTKSGTHLCMVLPLNSVIGSRNVVEIVNRFGYCISYHTAEALETEIATYISHRKYATPDGITQLVGLCTSEALDNSGELTQTLSGGGTLHYTVGICYENEAGILLNESFQEIPSQRQLPSVDNMENTMRHSSTTKFVFHLKEHTRESYRKTSKVTVFQYAVNAYQDQWVSLT